MSAQRVEGLAREIRKYPLSHIDQGNPRGYNSSCSLVRPASRNKESH